ncbi:DsbA family oxidoreductase [Gordonia sp. X0973]|uniref:DsbA family oxidoreductase n=1 Tax=Gordonia sp. X0973 TaxID=2742602 RepID=UPI000F51CBC4|nr:DsbA family oxidoreductase [Gordonia sp. X0973]QKT06565.1 DsbA family oxidoreductase [Gordonia sp. X0973]
MRVEIWSDINCPFCYLGKKRFEQALAQFDGADDVEVVHRSFELDPTLPADASQPVLGALAAKYGMSPEQAAAGEARLAAQAHDAGLDYVTQGRDMGNSFDMHRLVHFAAEQGRAEAMLDAFYAANFAEDGAAFGDRQRLIDVAVGAGFDEEAVRAVVDDPQAYADAVREDESQAAQLGVTGVPFFVFDRALAVSGAQPVETFAAALQRAAG